MFSYLICYNGIVLFLIYSYGDITDDSFCLKMINI